MPDSLSRYSLEELERLLAEIIRTIEQREQAASTPPVVDLPVAEVAAEPATALAVEAVVSAAPVSAPVPLAEPDPAPAPAPEEAAPVVRYVHPASRNLSWSGEGPVPDWVTAYLAYGGSWSAMEYAAEQYLEGIAKRKALNWPPPRNRR